MAALPVAHAWYSQAPSLEVTYLCDQVKACERVLSFPYLSMVAYVFVLIARSLDEPVWGIYYWATSNHTPASCK
ncbi:hypothetical protein PAXRUDRAFT_832888 [Paxillus rubicundulus Ve08.2h10]|uniref:Uncharacterized protein n=1 Tax=Paxillus rubicundulus Ve08.2h10 TaxID=930991 RepID=A0A0D0DIM2_9AGAM|nr:hypothetical protein PAXRUDRAFT_832888 [Paxillus rubicundulus Ve08.2h10]